MSKNKSPRPSSSTPDRVQDDAVPMPTTASASFDSSISAAKPRGYPLSIFNGKADEKFCCNYCKCILRDPVQASCGHRFCQECTKVMEALPQPLQCQSCVDEGNTDEDSYFDFKEIFEDKAARREMKKLQVKCMYQSCGWTGSFIEFIKHEENCDKKMVPCPQCGASVSKARLANHGSKSCPKRVVKCAFCKEQVIFEYKEKHNEECPKFLVKCDRCQSSVERYRLAFHQETVCANRVLICPLPECNTQLPMSQFQAHISKDMSVAKHVTHLLDRSDVTEQRLKTLEDRLQYSDESSQLTAATPSSSAVGGDHAQASAGFSLESCPSTSQDGAQAEGGGGTWNQEDRQKLKLHEDLMSVLHAEILRCITKGEAQGRGMEKLDNRLRDCYSKIEAVSDRVTYLETKFKELAQTSFDPTEYGELLSEKPGSFTWVIKNFSQIRERDNREMICSPTFVSCPGGYHMRLKFYPNGEGVDNRGKNVSLFLQIVKGAGDDLLLWPFSPKVHFMLVDQVGFAQHHVRTYEADPMSPVSRQPTDSVGIAGGCPVFISVRDLERKKEMFWPKDTLFLKFQVEVPKANMDRLHALNPLSFASSSIRS